MTLSKIVSIFKLGYEIQVFKEKLSSYKTSMRTLRVQRDLKYINYENLANGYSEIIQEIRTFIDNEQKDSLQILYLKFPEHIISIYGNECPDMYENYFGASTEKEKEILQFLIETLETCDNLLKPVFQDSLKRIDCQNELIAIKNLYAQT
jgi:hypothetical protein